MRTEHTHHPNTQVTAVSMARTLVVVLVVFVCLSIYHCAATSPRPLREWSACSGSRVPVLPPEPQSSFCGNVGPSCCDPAADAALEAEFEAMNVPDSDAACTTIVKAMLCKRCLPSLSPQPPLNAATIRSIPPRCTSPPPPRPPQQDAAVCLERLADDGTNYVGMAAHPDGSGRAFLYTQEGKIWLVSVPPRGSGVAMQVAGDGVIPFADLTSRALVLMGLAPHPEFAINGRVFLSYACSSAAGYQQLVVQEFFTAKGIQTGMATGGAAPTELRRIFTMDLPKLADDASNQQHGGGGQIFFRPGHGYLYLVTGHGGAGDGATSPFLGKIIRFDVDRVRVGAAANGPEIFATGLNDPRGCTFDSERPSNLYCAGVDHEQQEERVYLISNTAASASSPKAAASVPVIIAHGRPTAGEASSIVGGLVYRGSADPFLHARYMYVYGSSVWAAAKIPASNNSTLYLYPSARIPVVRCFRGSPLPCGGVGIAGSIVSLDQDNSKDAFFIATGGIYRVIPPGLCGGALPHAPLPHKAAPSSLVRLVSIFVGYVIATPAAVYLLYQLCSPGSGNRGQDQGQTATTNNSVTCNCCFPCTCCFCGTTDDNNDAPPIGGGQGGPADIQLTQVGLPPRGD